ncbi:MAG TPA: hypothetical protein PK801_11495 [Aggregatilineales bacterium]|nr:hypothetical protein [Aggregatilineales bacterium]HQE18099.1 hypothetical protein [Aggregatilineales bacterium]
MSRYQHTLTTILALLVALTLAACNLPAAQQATPAAPTPPPATSASELTPAPAEPTAPPAEPGANDGAEDGTASSETWPTLTSAELNLAIRAPEGWELTPADDHSAIVREVEGYGRAELTVLDETSAPRLGIEYRANVDAATILQELLVTFREDGDFTVHREVEVAGGYTAAISEGVWRPFDERLVVGVVALPDRAVVLTGHGPASSEEGGDEEWARLRPLYEGMLQGIAPKS